MSISPCIPAVWPEFSLTWRIGTSRYRFVVSNPDRLSCGTADVRLDGADVDATAIPMVDDGAEHEVRVLLGRRVGVGSSSGIARRH